jgi:hypothetical protein
MVEEPDFTRPLPPPKSSSNTVILIVALAVAGVVVVGVLAGLVVVLIPRSSDARNRLEDHNNLRQIVGVFLISSTELPLAPDGRLDVYAVVRKREVDRDHCSIFRSARSGKGPSWDEIQAGDYRNFPYRRRRGAVDRRSAVPVPILWDPEPTKDERLVAYSDFSVRFVDEATFRDFLRENPGQE